MRQAKRTEECSRQKRTTCGKIKVRGAGFFWTSWGVSPIARARGTGMLERLSSKGRVVQNLRGISHFSLIRRRVRSRGWCNVTCILKWMALERRMDCKWAGIEAKESQASRASVWASSSQRGAGALGATWQTFNCVRKVKTIFIMPFNNSTIYFPFSLLLS